MAFIMIICAGSAVYAGGAQEEGKDTGAASARIVSAEGYKVVSDLLFNSSKPVKGGTLRLPLGASPASYNIYSGIDNYGNEVMGAVHDALVEANPVTLAIEPALAESWDISADGKEIVFHLREGVKWSDGEAFTADDVLFTFKNFVMNANAEGSQIGRYTVTPVGGEPTLVELVKVDESTVKFVLPAPIGPFFLSVAASMIFPEHILAPEINPADPGSVNNIWTTDVDPAQIVGTGPFVPTSFVVDQKISLKANPNSWRMDPYGNVLPYVDALEYIIIPNAETWNIRLQSGDIDYIGGFFSKVNPNDFPMLKQDELDGKGIKVYAAQPTKATPSVPHVAFNFQVEGEKGDLLRDVRFRHAMEYSLDRDRIVEEAYNTLAVKLTGTSVLPSNKAFYNEDVEKYRRDFDIDKANALLDEIGIKDTDGDGIREFASGKDVAFVITTSNSGTKDSDISLILKEGAAKAGVKLDLNIVEGSALGGLLWGSGDFEIACRAFGSSPDPGTRKGLWSPVGNLYYVHLDARHQVDGNWEIIEENLYDWEKDVYEAFEKGAVTVDPAERKAAYDVWQEAFAKEAPYIYVVKGMDVVASRDNLGNFFMHDDGLMALTPYTVFKK